MKKPDDTARSKGATKREARRGKASFNDLVRDLWFNVGYQTALGQEDDSIKELRRIIELNPADAAAFLYLGRIYLEKRDYQKAEYYLACAAELDSSRPEIAFNYGTCLAINGHHQKSVPWLKVATELWPDDPSALFNLGMSHLVLDNADEAMQLFSHTLQLNPQHLPSAYNLGIYFMRTNQIQRAKHYFEKCISIDPEFPQAWQQMLRVCLNEKNIVAADMIIRKGIELVPDDPGLLVDQAAFENLEISETEIMENVSQALEELPELVPEALERIAQFKSILETAIPEILVGTIQ